MNGQNRQNIKPGLTVDIVLKKDQPTGKLTRGIVADILTSSTKHHRGIKVRLQDGQVGRVQNIVGADEPSQVKLATKAPGLRVDIWADIVCPFCYIGERQLQKALAQFEHKDAVKIILHSFELNPKMPKLFAGTLDEYLAQHKGVSTQDAHEMNSGVVAYAASVGLSFKLDTAKPTNSFDAHRLLHLAKKYKLQLEMMERLRAAYFCEGKNIGDRDELKKLAIEVGVVGEAVDKMFATADYDEEVRADEDTAARHDITGVPFFSFGHGITVVGAEASEVFLEALQRASVEGLPAS